MNRHELKTHRVFYKACVDGRKTFEIRRNDRNFYVGDELLLREIDGSGEYTGWSCLFRITYILNRREKIGRAGLAPGYCLLSIEKVK